MALETTNVLIYGSCVSRDIFRFQSDGFIVVDYYARSSLISLGTAPLEFSPEDVCLESKFQKRMVIRDLTKDLYSRLEIHDYDVLLMDFIDERLNIISIGDVKITKSKELSNSGLMHKYIDFNEIDRFEMDFCLWEEACDTFINNIINYINPDRIILLEAFGAKKYRKQDGTVHVFPENIIKYINSRNSLLESYYKYFLDNFRTCQVVNCEEAIADESHLWGLSPFHFTQDWYEDAAMRIQEVVGQTGNNRHSGFE